MNAKQFEQILSLPSIFGQWVSLLTVTDQEKNVKPQYKGRGIKKVTKFQAHVRKQSYMDVLNTSTGAVALGIEFKAKRASYYNDVAHNGFCRSLVSDPNKLYIEIRFNEKDKGPELSVLIDDAGNLYDFDILKEKPFNKRGELVAECEVSIRQFKIESIARMKVCGLDLIDEDLNKYENVMGLAFDAAL